MFQEIYRINNWKSYFKFGIIVIIYLLGQTTSWAKPAAEKNPKFFSIFDERSVYRNTF